MQWETENNFTASQLVRMGVACLLRILELGIESDFYVPSTESTEPGFIIYC